MGAGARPLLDPPLGGWRPELGRRHGAGDQAVCRRLRHARRYRAGRRHDRPAAGRCPDYRRVFVVRSEDEGATWSTPIELATLPDRRFEEPAPLLLGSGRVLALLRENASRSLWRSWSDDGGLSWAEPVPTGIDGCPAHLTGLPDGRILCTYGFRRPPYAIRATISSDEGNTWSSPVEVRTGLPNSDLGYPCILPTAAALCTVYYAQDQNECTCILVTHWTLPTHI